MIFHFVLFHFIVQMICAQLYSTDHARELEQIVQQVKSITGQTHVNIVGHSKGGLDARVFLANTGTSDAANPIMIGTPNAGSILADIALSDL